MFRRIALLVICMPFATSAGELAATGVLIENARIFTGTGCDSATRMRIV